MTLRDEFCHEKTEGFSLAFQYVHLINYINIYKVN